MLPREMVTVFYFLVTVVGQMVKIPPPPNEKRLHTFPKQIIIPSKTSNLWGVLPPSFLQESYKLSSSNCNINKHNQISLSVDNSIHSHFGGFGIGYGAFPKTTYCKCPMTSSIYRKGATDLLKK